uniref:histidine kinase n=1 Tax=Bionectria ochroleuca TaxID=29856 RepID=A0A0B7K6R3_BIOOC
MAQRGTRPPWNASEASRQDEVTRYGSTLLSTSRFNNNPTEPIPSVELSTSNDAILTALCQLGAWQTGTGRAFLSLFGAHHQHIVAEAMPSLPLQPSLPSKDCPAPLWLCGTAIPRSYGVCEGTAIAENSDRTNLPLTLCDNLATDPRFSDKPYHNFGGEAKFYAAVPVRTRRGINIGVYCVVDETPGRPWNDTYTAHLQYASRNIMNHLESQLLKSVHRRNERMTRGLGSFVEGETTLSGWRFSPNSAAYANQDNLEGALNAKQQSLGLFPAAQTSLSAVDATAQTPLSIMDPKDDSYFATEPAPAPERDGKVNVYSRAANIIRESIEVEGCVFYRPRLSFRAHPDPQTGDHANARGYTSSIDSVFHTNSGPSITEAFLANLLRKYPQGTTFKFDAEGGLLSSDSSGDEGIPLLASSSLSSRTKSTEDLKAASLPPSASAEQQQVTSRAKRSRSQEGKALRDAFPNARSVLFSPVWDSRKDGWYAAAFAYTHREGRSFSVTGELSYVRAFGAVVASEIQKLNTLSADQAKADALGSLSHELRSPLHGVLLSAELMMDTDMDIHQGNLAHTIETCSRTLLDTIDHLLDYSQISDFSKPGRKSGIPFSNASSRGGQGQFGKTSLFSYIRLDGVVEEVVESVFAGFNFQYQSLRQASQSTMASDVAAHQRLDSAQASEQLQGRGRDVVEHLEFGNVSVLLSIDSGCQWEYHVHVGAIRRIIMNLFGNALKYTESGIVVVNLSQDFVWLRRRRRHVVRISVRDTGKGMSADFLQTGLFKPFSQEDTMSPGTGLGLSLVKNITTQLHGRISIDSQVGVGTTVSVVVPLKRAELPADIHASRSNDDKQFDGLVHDLKGLRVRIITADEASSTAPSAVNVSLHDICRDWLHMEVVSTEMSLQAVVPDIVLWSYDASVQAQGDIKELSKFPNVVICPNALVAYHRNTEPTSFDGVKLLEFVSQPIGPRKLAKVLSLAYRRWVEPSHPFNPQSIEAPLTVSRPKIFRSTISSSVVSDIDSLNMTPQKTETGGLAPMCTSTPASSISNGGQSDKDERDTRCLLVDDNDINIKVLSALMRKLGIDYQTARNGKEALDVFSQNPGAYICILMDISMPVMDGFEATRCIRAFEIKECLQPVSIIALSGLSSDEAHREAFESGMDLFLTKPVKLMTLKDLLQSRGII